MNPYGILKVKNALIKLVCGTTDCIVLSLVILGRERDYGLSVVNYYIIKLITMECTECVCMGGVGGVRGASTSTTL
jgi:hypothetical protein